ncbi:MAG: hypothetical protein AAFV69_12355, partial [Pseudomonadota bacterium]
MKGRMIAAICAAAIAFGSLGANAGDNLTSATILDFADAQTLFVADPNSSRIVAFSLPDMKAAQEKPVGYNLTDFASRVAAVVNAPYSAILYNDLAVHPVTKSVRLYPTGFSCAAFMSGSENA